MPERERKESPQFRLICTLQVDGEDYEVRIPISEKWFGIGRLRIHCPNRHYCFIEPIGSALIPIEVDITKENAQRELKTETVRPSLSPGVAIEHEGQFTSAEIYIVKSPKERAFIAKVIYGKRTFDKTEKSK